MDHKLSKTTPGFPRLPQGLIRARRSLALPAFAPHLVPRFALRVPHLSPPSPAPNCSSSSPRSRCSPASSLPALANNRPRSDRVICANNLRQIGMGFQLWGNDHNDTLPQEVPVLEGGTMQHALAPNVWLHMAWLSNEVATPKIFLCPSDTGQPASDFTGNPAGGYLHSNFRNAATSYFLGYTGASIINDPDATIAGDRNVSNAGVTGCSRFNTALRIPTPAPGRHRAMDRRTPRQRGQRADLERTGSTSRFGRTAPLAGPTDYGQRLQAHHHAEMRTPALPIVTAHPRPRARLRRAQIFPCGSQTSLPARWLVSGTQRSKAPQNRARIPALFRGLNRARRSLALPASAPRFVPRSELRVPHYYLPLSSCSSLRAILPSPPRKSAPRPTAPPPLALATRIPPSSARMDDTSPSSATRTIS